MLSHQLKHNTITHFAFDFCFFACIAPYLSVWMLDLQFHMHKKLYTYTLSYLRRLRLTVFEESVPLRQQVLTLRSIHQFVANKEINILRNA